MIAEGVEGMGMGQSKRVERRNILCICRTECAFFVFLFTFFYLFFVCIKLNLRIAESWLLLLIGSIVWVPKSPIIVVPATSREKGWKGRW